jgi:hypothetical protein
MRIKLNVARESYPGILWVPLIIYCVIGFGGLAHAPFYERSLEMINSGIKMNQSESAFIEHLEAIFWLLGFVLYLSIVVRNKYRRIGFFWYVLFAALCFLAFGEDTRGKTRREKRVDKKKITFLIPVVVEVHADQIERYGGGLEELNRSYSLRNAAGLKILMLLYFFIGKR